VAKKTSVKNIDLNPFSLDFAIPLARPLGELPSRHDIRKTRQDLQDEQDIGGASATDPVHPVNPVKLSYPAARLKGPGPSFRSTIFRKMQGC